MKRLAVLLVLTPLLLGACTSLEAISAYENDELVAVRHNQTTDCTLLIYRDPMGQTRHVFRKHGIFEFGLTFHTDGGISLKERGRDVRDIEAVEASRVTERINTLMQVAPQGGQHAKNTSNTET